jgi:hypothetical protein
MLVEMKWMESLGFNSIDDWMRVFFVVDKSLVPVIGLKFMYIMM